MASKLAITLANESSNDEIRVTGSVSNAGDFDRLKTVRPWFVLVLCYKKDFVSIKTGGRRPFVQPHDKCGPCLVQSGQCASDIKPTVKIPARPMNIKSISAFYTIQNRTFLFCQFSVVPRSFPSVSHRSWIQPGRAANCVTFYRFIYQWLKYQSGGALTSYRKRTGLCVRSLHTNRDKKRAVGQRSLFSISHSLHGKECAFVFLDTAARVVKALVATHFYILFYGTFLNVGEVLESQEINKMIVF